MKNVDARTPMRVGAVLLGALALAIALVVTGSSLGPPAANAAGATIRVDPASQNVAGGQKFVVSIIQNADVPTNGVQTNFSFDARLLRIVGVEAGAPYRGAQFIFGDSSLGTNGNIADAVAAANRTGQFLGLATYILPGAGRPVPAGDAVFLKLTLQALGPAGTSALTLGPIGQKPDTLCSSTPPCYANPMEVVDANGSSVAVTARNGTVTISGGAPAGPVETGTPTAGATPTATKTSSVQGVTSGPALLTVAPASSKIAVGGTTDINLKVRLPVEATGVQADISFNKKVISIEKITAGPAWSGGQLIAGSSGQDTDAALGDANKTGKLKGAGVLLTSGGSSVQPGEETALVLSVKGLDDGKSTFKVSNISLVDAQGQTVKISGKDATLTVGSGSSGGGSSMLWILLVVLGIVVVGAAGGGFWYVRRRSA